MVAMDVQLEPSSSAFLLKAAKRFPNEVRRAFYMACGIALRNMRSRMTGKSDKVAQWDAFTKRYRAMATWNSAGTFGGKLMWPDKKKLTMEPRGDRVRVGWIGPLEDAANRFQEGGSSHNSWEWRRARVEQGFTMHEVPEVSVTPPRPVVDPVKTEARANLDKWVMESLARVLSGRISSWEKRYTRLSTESRHGGSIGRRGEIIRKRGLSAMALQKSVNIWLADLKGADAKMAPGTR